MNLLLCILFLIFGVGGVFCLSKWEHKTNILKDPFAQVPTPQSAQLCDRCDLKQWCLPSMHCWEAYREAAREILGYDR